MPVFKANKYTSFPLEYWYFDPLKEGHFINI